MSTETAIKGNSARWSDIYKPIQKQEEAFSHVGKKSRILYGWARGGGKTSFSVWTAMSSCLIYPGLSVGLIRAKHKEMLAQIVDHELKRYFFDDRVPYKYFKSDKLVEFKNGSKIHLISKDIETGRGQFLKHGLYILDEGTQLPWDHISDILELTNSKSKSEIRSVRGELWKNSMVITGCPGYKSQQELIDRWIKPDYSKWDEKELDQKDEYVFVNANIYDNEHLGEEYRERMEELPPTLKKMWLGQDYLEVELV